jgi:8-oxo-dGTP diphosphatase
MKEFVGVVVASQEGKILCQLRDDIPEIIFPGLWTCCPGGTVEKGELPKDAVIREMREEFEIEIDGIQLLTTFSLSGDFSGYYYIYSANLKSLEKLLKCNEGQQAEFFSAEQTLKLRQHPISLGILKKYLANHHFENKVT